MATNYQTGYYDPNTGCNVPMDVSRAMEAKRAEAMRDCGPPKIQQATELQSIGYDLESTLEGLHAANRRLIEISDRLLGPRPEQETKSAGGTSAAQTVWRLRDVANYMRSSLAELHESISYLERL